MQRTEASASLFIRWRIPNFGFDYDKLKMEEIQAFSILTSFQMIKVNDIMEMFGDQEKLLEYLGKDYRALHHMCFTLCSILCFYLFIYSEDVGCQH